MYSDAFSAIIKVLILYPKRLFMKKFWKIIGRLFLTLLFLIIAFLVIRVVIASDESVMDDIIATDNLKEAYKNGESEIFALTHNVPYQISEKDGYFSAYSFVYIPSANQLQIVVRYNNTVYRQLADREAEKVEKDPLYDAITVSEGEEFLFVLRNEKTGEEILPTVVESAEKWMYQYRRLVFDGVTVDKECDLWIDMRPADGEETINMLVCHYSHQYTSMDIYKLNRAEKKALSAD